MTTLWVLVDGEEEEKEEEEEEEKVNRCRWPSRLFRVRRQRFRRRSSKLASLFEGLSTLAHDLG